MNPAVSPGLSDIVSRCVADRPADRYPTAAALANDLRRHLTDQPLAGVANRSLAERWHKWRRRRPAALRTAALAALAAGAVGLLVVGAGWQAGDRRQQAEQALRDGRAQLEGGNPAEAVRTFERGLARADRLPLAGDLRTALGEQAGRARRRHLADRLHALADDVRGLSGTDAVPAGRLGPLAEQCREFWGKHHPLVDALGPAPGSEVAADLMDVALFAADLRVRLAAGPEAAAAREEALRLFDEAEALFGPSAVLAHERQVHRRALGLPADAAADPPAPRTAWEHCALGRAYLGAGDLDRASDVLAAAVRLDPGGRWPNFYYGLCAHRAGRHEDALAAFSVCVGAAPGCAACYSNRGLAHVALGRTGPALADYDRALELDPTLAAAALNRAMLRLDLKQYELALADLDRTLENGADAAAVHHARARVHVAAGNRAAALIDLRRALEHRPGHEEARRLREALGEKGRLPPG